MQNKVHIFWEGHKLLWNLHLTFVYTVDKSKVEIWQNFVAFSEYINLHANYNANQEVMGMR